MFKFDLKSPTYMLVADGISAVVGKGADLLAKSFCNNIIDNSEVSNGQRLSMKVGAVGVRSVASCGIALETRKIIDSVCGIWNDLVDIYFDDEIEIGVEPEIVDNTVVVEDIKDDPIDISSEVG